MSARCFISGWNVHTPNQNILYHAYTRDDEPKFWNDHRYAVSRVHQKVNMIIGLMKKDFKKLGSLGKTAQRYGLGKEHSLREFYEFIGVDPKQKKASQLSIEFFTVSTPHCPTDNDAFWQTLIYEQIIVVTVLFLILCFYK